MKNIYENLSWLQKPNDDFSNKLKSASSIRDLKELSTYALDEIQLGKVSKKLNSFTVSSQQIENFKTLKIGILSNSTTSLITPVLNATALRYGIILEIHEAEFNQIAQEAFAANSFFQNKKLDVILLSIDINGLPFISCPGDKNFSKKNIHDCIEYLNKVIQGLKSKTGAQIIMQNFVSPTEQIFGSYERRLEGTLSSFVFEINSHLDKIQDSSVFILDVANLASKIGLYNWFDPTLWNLTKIPFAPKYLPIYADFICRILSAILGKSRRCLVLDLDNTLWGGVIGDDGLEGILIGNGDATGEAHLHLQKTVLLLRERGIVLAVCSKNEDTTARLPFKEHPDMLLRENHIAVFQANWTDKATNIKAISETLSLGLESIVFVDDNPAERKRVRDELPEVAVPEMPNDPALFVPTIIASGYFESINFSNEDSKRAEFYQANAKRVELINQSIDMNSYLKSLEMEIKFKPFDEQGRSRIHQLISKSNQFNLTTIRHTQDDLINFENNENYFTRQIRLKDIFGDNGMICVIICNKAEREWKINTWLMSCRVLNRRVEESCLNHLVHYAKKDGVKKLIGKYLPTKRNIIVKDHYKKLGFVQVSKDGESETWELNLKEYEYKDIPIRINE